LKKRAVFLDRDGTLIVDKNYLSDPTGVVLFDRTIESLIRMMQLSLSLVVVSNQSGVGRGYFSMKDVDAVNSRIDSLLRQDGIEIAGWYVCPHAPDEKCSCRKPKPGMIEAASQDLGLDPSRSYVIGDKRADIDLALAVGACGILVTTGYGANDTEYARSIGAPVCADLLAASELIALYSPPE
jgi:histidinol-phosphate phosphatase family protein